MQKNPARNSSRKTQNSPVIWDRAFCEAGARDLLQALRGRRSQAWLSKRLGFAFNKVGRWENGTATFHWGDFVDLAATCKLALKEALAMYFGYAGPAREDAGFAAYLLAGVPAPEARCLLGWSERQLQAQVRGQRRLQLAEVLVLAALNRFDIFAFLARFTRPDELPTFRVAAQLWAREAALYVAWPATYGVIRCLELEDAGPIGPRLGITPAEEQHILAELERLGLISRHDGKRYVLSERALRPTYVGGRDAARWKMIQYWSEKAVAATGRRGKGSTREGEVWSFRVVACSDDAYAELRRLSIDYLNSLESVLERHEHEPDTRLSVLNVQLFDPGT